MAKANKKNATKMVVFDFTEYYNNIKKQEEIDRAEAAAYASQHVSDASVNKPTLWQRIKGFFKRKK